MPSFVFIVARRKLLTSSWRVSFPGHTFLVLAINCMTVRLCSMDLVSFHLEQKESAMCHSSTSRIAAKITLIVILSMSFAHHKFVIIANNYVKVSPDTTTKRTIRGLKWCNSPECKKNPIQCCDEVGATNIMIRGRPDINPNNPLFDRQEVRWHKRSPKQKLFYARRNMMDVKK